MCIYGVKEFEAFPILPWNNLYLSPHIWGIIESRILCICKEYNKAAKSLITKWIDCAHIRPSYFTDVLKVYFCLPCWSVCLIYTACNLIFGSCQRNTIYIYDTTQLHPYPTTATNATIHFTYLEYGWHEEQRKYQEYEATQDNLNVKLSVRIVSAAPL